MRASLEEVKSVIIIGDDAILHPKILHMIHSILLTGYASGILGLEDKSNIIEVILLITVP